MIDTLRLWVDRCNIPGGNPFGILPCLSDVTDKHNKKYGYFHTGRLKNYFVSVYESGISLYGSLAKYLLGDNIQTLTRKDVQKAIKALGDDLHTDISAARVTRLDISNLLYTKHPPADYFRYLGEKPYFKRLEVAKDETLRYINYQRQIEFYDKAKEAEAHDTPIPENLQDMNLLRYEVRYLENINTQLEADVTAGILHNREFYDYLVKCWQNEFKTIQKLKKQSFMIDNITTVKEAETALFAHLLQQSGPSTIGEFLNELRAKDTFKDRQRYCDIKRNLNKISATYEYSEKSDLMQELEVHIFDIAKYAR